MHPTVNGRVGGGERNWKQIMPISYVLNSFIIAYVFNNHKLYGEGGGTAHTHSGLNNVY